MVLGRRVARLNRVGLNRVTRHLVPHVPGFGLVIHRGRRSGRTYCTPVNVFPTASGVIIALTYGPNADWVRNVLAAGGATLVMRGRAVELASPTLYHDGQRRGIRPVERRILGWAKVFDFLALEPVDATATAPSTPEADVRA